MGEKAEKKRLAILGILREANKPLGSSKITERLVAAHYEISERTVRLYLKNMDEQGLTENLGRKGRRITAQGLEELGHARIIDRVGYLTAKIDQMTYRMDFDLSSRSGSVVTNLSIVGGRDLNAAIPSIKRVFEAGYAMGRLVTLFAPLFYVMIYKAFGKRRKKVTMKYVEENSTGDR